MARPASIASFDAAAAAEALDLFDDKNTSFRTSKLAAAGAVFGSSPRFRGLADVPKQGSPTHPTRLLRRSTSEALGRPTSSIATPSRLRSSSAAPIQERPGSPDIETILARTARPRRASSAVFSSPSQTSLRSVKPSHSSSSLQLDRKSTGEDDESIFSISDYGALLEEDESQSDGDRGSESDSSIDIHTPLPHLMFRDGLLSPRSKLLPQDAKPSPYPLGTGANDRSRSVVSIVSTAGSFVTKSGLQKDPRDTVRRRQRHRDGALLRAGMGLTTGLGWSDSEDEDAPSALTRRLLTTTLDRKRSASVALSSLSRPTSSQYDDLNLSRFASPVPMSRFTSPVPSSKHIVARKSTGSFVGMRSMPGSQLQSHAATISFPSTPVADSKLPPTPEGRSATRKRTPSTTSVSSKIKSPSIGSTGLPPVNTQRQRATSSVSSTQIPVLRSRAGSMASNVASAVSGLRSRTVSSASTTPSQHSRHRTESSTSSVGHSIPAMPRPSLESLASESLSSLSSASDHTTSSVYSSSTASASSGSAPRPLRLVQSITARSQSHDPIAQPTSSTTPVPSTLEETSAPSQRPRALSGPRPRPQARSPTPTQNHSQSQPFGYNPPALQRNFTYPQPEDIPSPSSPPDSIASTLYYSPISTPPLTDAPSGMSNISPSPTSPSSPRPRAALIGARPKPRTGTGMAYRTSSFPNLQAQASALKMRTLATGPTAVSMAAEGGSGHPVRI